MTKHLYQFGPFELDLLAGRLLREGEPVALTPKAFDLLRVLVENHGRLLEKSALMRQLWADTFVEDANITQHVFTLRKILGEQAKGGPYIDTVPRRGYVFVAPVEEIIEPALTDQTPERPAAPVRIVEWRSALIAAFLAAVAVGIFYIGVRRPASSAPAAAGGPKIIAVLPFRNLDRGATDAYLALGMADALITRLAQVQGIIVRPTGSVLKYVNSTSDPLASGRDLGAESLVDGRFQLVGDRIRVTVQLLNVRDGSSIWANTFDEPFTGVFAVQDTISERVAGALVANLTREEREQLTRPSTQNIEAYQLYMRGRYSWEQRTDDSLRASTAYYEQAIAKDPKYALAYAGLADSYNILGNFGALPPGDAYPKAQAAAAKALDIDGRLAQARVAAAFATYLYDRDWDTADRAFTQALADAPAYGPGHQWYAVCLLSRGRFDDALAEIRRAQEVEPGSIAIQAVTAWIYYLARNDDAAIAAATRTIETEPHFLIAHEYLGMAYVSKHRDEDAVAELRLALPRSGGDMTGSNDVLGLLGLVLARQGRTAEARDLLGLLQRNSHERYTSPYGEALVRLGLGEKDQALTLLERATDEHYPWIVHFNIDPALDPLRGERRFDALLRRIHIPRVPR